MTMPESNDYIDDDKLQRLFDGDLTEGEEKILRRDVAKSETEQARVAQLDRLGDLIRLSGEEVGADIDSSALFARIEAGVAADKSPRLELIGNQPKRQRTVGVVAVGFAMAAAVALVFYLMPGADPNIAVNPMDDNREVLVENDLPMVEIHPPAGSAVEQVDFGSNTGTVFEVEGAEGQPLAVVWIAEE
ncbi:MAG: hypothetical protein AB8H86_23905 [Polyangiales bacterium]